MRSCFVLAIYLLFINKKVSSEQGYYGGWRPLTNEEAYRRLNINVPKFNNLHLLDPPWHSFIKTTADNVEEIKTNVIKLIEPQKILGNFSIKRFGLPTKPDSNEEETKDTVETNFAKVEISTVKNIRKPKKIEDRNFDIPINILIQDQNTESIDKFQEHYKRTKNDETADDEEADSYQVTETLDATGTRRTEENSGYEYSPPNIKPPETKNLTNIFHNILGKYNINTNDKLTNYEKSLVPNNSNQNKQILFVPFPIRYFERFNSLNHLPVDPLIAVFLSNYGHYIPSYYGLQNNYRNLYGYLASNNIHNNKPFGSYKVFSDTDSSSK